MNEFRNDGCDDKVVCFDCGSSNVAKEFQRQVFQYGNGEDAVELTAEMSVFTCKACGYQFAGPEADDARHEAVCRHLGLLTPQEIVSIREQAGLSQAQFANRTRIGIASLKRWETGVVIQNAANDELIYLMTFPENIQRLNQRNRMQPLENSVTAVPTLEPQMRHRTTSRFRARCIVPEGILLECSRRWVLRN
jgi:putative zinc finger/helix-turn-helix YgiT family protein